MLKKTPVAVLVAILITVLAIPASAASRFTYRNTGRAATASWTQIDGTAYGTMPFGNVHIGYLYAYEMTSGQAWVSAFIADFDCPEGAEPGWGDGGGTGCDHLGDRYGDGSNMALTLDRKLTAGSLSGQLNLYSGDFSQVVAIPVNITLTGQGALSKTTSTYRWNDGTSTYSTRSTSQYRNATVSGYIGDTVLGGVMSSGTLESFKSFDMSRSR